MHHELSLISTLAAGFGIALVLGYVAVAFHLPALVGYLLAGILIGPATPGFVADVGIASQLSEIGVMLLMFGVGLHFSLGDLFSVRRVALPGAVVQMGLATLLGAWLAAWWGWSWGEALVFGVSLSCASTVVLLKALEARGVLESFNGKIAVGWLVVEDLVTVVVLVLLPPLAAVLGGSVAAISPGTSGAGDPLWVTIGQTLLQVAAFIVLMLLVGRRVMPWLLSAIARTGSRELFTLAVVAAAIGIAVGAAMLFHVSFALGAFFAGMVMRESEFSHRAAEESLPLRDAFSVLFFVSVGMLFDPAVLLSKPLHVLGVVAIIVVGKTLAAIALVIALRYPLRTALLVGASLAQIGEFSFILAGLGRSLGLLTAEGMSLVLAGALISIALNPLLFAAIEPVRSLALRHWAWARVLDSRPDPYGALPADTDERFLQGQVVLVGYGRVGRQIARSLTAAEIPHVIVDENREIVEDLRRAGVAAVSGNGADAVVLVQAHIATASMLVVAIPDPLAVRPMIATARTLNASIEIVIRTHSEGEAGLLRKENAGKVFYGEEELARGMVGHVLERYARNKPTTRAATA
ncbi:MAG: cation:proton antiporter [Burkholderiaceae bacterium]